MRRAGAPDRPRGARRSQAGTAWRSRLLWFVALYGAGLAAFAAVSAALRALMSL